MSSIKSSNQVFTDWVAEVGGPTKAASLLGVSVESVLKWRSGERRPRPPMALHIERVSGGSVPRDSLLWPSEAA